MLGFPIEAPRTQQLRVLHQLDGEQYLVLALQLKCGDDIEARVLEAFQQGKLPGYLFAATLEYAALAVREALADPGNDDSLKPNAEEGQVPSHPAPAVVAKPWWDEVRLPSTLLVKSKDRDGLAGPVSTSPACDLTFWRAYDFLLRHRPSFFRTIGTLEEAYLKENCELLVRRQTSISQLQMRQSIEMENVRQQAERLGPQSEASRAPEDGRGGGDDEEGAADVGEEATERAVPDEPQHHSGTGSARDVQSLVAQHVSELDAVELHWRTEIEMLKVKQKASYRDLVVDFFEQEMEQITPEGCEQELEAAAASAPDVGDEADKLASPLRTLAPAPLLPAASGMSRRSEAAEGGDEPTMTANEDTSRPLVECAEIRAAFGQQRIFFVLRLWAGDIMELMHTEEVYPPSDPVDEDDDVRAACARPDTDGAGPQLPPELVGLSSCGGNRYFASASGLPVQGVGWPLLQTTAPLQSRSSDSDAVDIQGPLYQSTSLQFWAAPLLPRPVRLSPNAYAAHLRGLVIPTPENPKFETTQATMLREFATRCDQFTDLHFAPLAAQLQHVRASTGDVPLKTGDYFCTRHSNLGGTLQAAFHLLAGSSDASDEIPSSVHRALRRIVRDCHTCHVAELSLPLLLLDMGTSESSLPYTVAQRRSENVLRALKGALTQLADDLAPSELPELAVLNLVLPPSCAQNINARVPSVVESTLTFVRHSFQCV